jgi:hypothetical protein
MVKYYMFLLCAIYTVHAGNSMGGCLSKAAGEAETIIHQEIDNGDAALIAQALAAKALPKLLANQNVQKFEDKTKIKATAGADGSYAFSLLGVPVGTLQQQQDPAEVALQLVPHIIAAHKAAATIQPSSSVPSSAPAPAQ